MVLIEFPRSFASEEDIGYRFESNALALVVELCFSA